MGMHHTVTVLYGWQITEETEEQFPDEYFSYREEHDYGNEDPEIIVCYDHEEDETFFGLYLVRTRDDGYSEPSTARFNALKPMLLANPLLKKVYLSVGQPSLYVISSYE